MQFVTQIFAKSIRGSTGPAALYSGPMKGNAHSQPRAGLTQGQIDLVQDGQIKGWMFAEDAFAQPYVTVNGSPATLTHTAVPRPDVEDAIGVKGAFGFHARLPKSYHGPVTIALYVVSAEHVRLVHERTISVSHTDGFSPLDLDDAIATARQPQSVAIVVWDAAHNPAGRAKVLYDIVVSQRPAVIFGFCHREFGETLWEPLQTSDVKVCLINPEDFEIFRSEARAAQLTFDTIWMCKPRLPTFVLAELLAHERTAMILDIDDNEEAFSRGPNTWGRWYGETSINKAALYRESFTVRSVASISLQERFGGEIVRHVRKPLPKEARRPQSATNGERASGSRSLSLVFIGSVRPHKGLLEAARAVRLAAYAHQLDVTLTVGGTFDPPDLESELQSLGVKTIGAVPTDELPSVLTGFDAVLTGFPTATGFDAIQEFQVSSKVGDALRVGLPVLVPRSSAVRDLAEVDGVHLFDVSEFADVLLALAQSPQASPALPPSFCVNGGYEIFAKLEAVAKKDAASRPAVSASGGIDKNVLIIWKQNDAGLYGRRVDQIARMLSQTSHEYCVRVLEFAEEKMLSVHAPDAIHTSPEFLHATEANRKLGSKPRDGVHYHTLLVPPETKYGADSDPNAPLGPTQSFRRFLSAHQMLPHNTVVILMPLLPPLISLDAILPQLRRYKIIVDVVDNQLSWSTRARQTAYLAQYRAASDIAQRVVFNCDTNQESMVMSNVAGIQNSCVISNWYSFPSGWTSSEQRSVGWDQNRKHAIYSGDLNNRIDWDLLDRAADLIAEQGGILHLVGASQRVNDELARILKRPSCVYHGPMREEDALDLLSFCDFGIVPHLQNIVSMHMNPIKIKMYERLALPHIVTDISGVDRNSKLTIIAPGHGKFLEHVDRLLAAPRSKTSRPQLNNDSPPEAVEYEALVRSLFQ